VSAAGRLLLFYREFFRDHPEKFDFREPGTIFVQEYADFIAHKNEKLGSAGKLDEVGASVKR
jgi:fructose-bisphosphate aldolase class II